MFNRFDIVGAYDLYVSRLGYSGLPLRHLRSTALKHFRPGLTLSQASQLGSYVLKTDDYQGTRDAYARLLRRARRAMRARAALRKAR